MKYADWIASTFIFPFGLLVKLHYTGHVLTASQWVPENVNGSCTPKLNSMHGFVVTDYFLTTRFIHNL